MPRAFFKDSLILIRAFLSRNWHVAPLFIISLIALAGIAVGEFAGGTAFQFSVIAIAFAAVGFVFLDLERIRVTALFGFVLCGFAGLHAHKIDQIRSFSLLPNLNEGQSIRVSDVHGVVISEPTLVGTGARHSGRSVLKISKFKLAGRIWDCRQKVPVFFEYLPENLNYGDEIITSGIFQPLVAATSPGAFDEKKFHFRTNDATAKFEIQVGDQTRIVPQNRGNPVVKTAIATRKWLETALRHGIENHPVESRSVITAMVLGNREDAPEEVEDLFRLSGTMHIFAVSGLHVGIIAASIWLILPLFGISRRAASFIFIPIIVFYAFVTGLRPSAIRAAIMISVIAFAFCLRKNPRTINSLGFAALVILLLNTQEAFQIGFQLSFAVLLAILLFAEKIGQWFYQPFQVEPLIPRRLIAAPRRWLDVFMQKLCSGFGISLAAWSGSLLLIGWYFKIISLTGVIANIIMIPLATGIIWIAVASSIAFAVHATWLTALLNQANAFLAGYLVKCAFVFSSIPGGYISAPSFQPPPDPEIPAAFSLEIVANNGSAAQLLSTPALGADSSQTPRHWLLDTGDSFLFRGKIQPLLRSNGINQLDGVFLSHGDQAHLGAMPIVLDRFRPAMIFESHLKNRARAYKEIEALTDLQNTPRYEITRGGRLDLARDLRCEILFPPPGHPDQPRADDHCLVLRLRHHDWKILFTFDAGFSTEKWLLENEPDLKSDVWIKGRHANTPSGLSQFVTAVEPKVVIATNSGFPIFEKIPDDWILDLKKRGIDFYDLTVEGAVSVRGAAQKIQITSFLNSDHEITLIAP